MDIRLNLDTGIRGTVRLTGSKSECNRAQILAALAPGEITISNFSDADDCIILQRCLARAKGTRTGDNNESYNTINIGPAGTAARFMAAYLCLLPGKFILDGTPRMRLRPIGILVNALRDLGGKVSCLAEEGFLPLQIDGGIMEKRHQKVEIDGSVSSQYISALMLIGWRLPQGLEIMLKGKPTSTPYITMTAGLLEKCGITVNIEDQKITLSGAPRKTVLYIEPDWSAAGYWYAIAALTPGAEIYLPGLQEASLQGDSRCASIYSALGLVDTEFNGEGAILHNTTRPAAPMVIDFTDIPDLAQTVIVTCAACGRADTFTGLHTLRVKETDRIEALKNELKKVGAMLSGSDETGFTLTYEGQGIHAPTAAIDTYDDHRMAMAFAQLGVLFNLEIRDAAVVSKSYPGFWRDLRSVGFNIEEHGR